MKPALILILTCMLSYLARASSITVSSGNDWLDDKTTLQNALNGNDTVKLTAGQTYYLSNTLSIPTNRTLIGNGATIKAMASFPNTNTPLIESASTSTSYTGKNISVLKGKTTWLNSTGINVTVGKFIRIIGGQRISAGSSSPYTYGWFGYVTGVIGDTVTMSHPASYNFTGTTLYQTTGTTNIQLSNLTVDMAQKYQGHALDLNYSKNTSVTGSTIRADSAEVGIATNCISCQFTNNVISGFLNNVREAGYGITANGHDITISGNTGYNSETSFTVGAGRSYMSTNISYLNNTATGIETHGAHPLDAHANVSGLTVTGNTVSSSASSNGTISIRCLGPILVDNNTINVTKTGN